HVIALSGTHGKTTTATMVTHCLVALGLSPGYLIGGIPQGLSASAEVGQSGYFVIEADEYDTAFFDKRSKFIHYHPRTLVINNLEFDHADIFDDLAAIQRQFHHVIRTIAQQGCVISPETPAIESVLKQGLWCEQQTLALASDVDLQADIGSGWQARLLDSAGSEFEVFYDGELCGTVSWQLIGEHNMMNGLAAIAAVAHAVSAQLPQSEASAVSITVQQIIEALSQFAGVKRRLEVIAEHQGITVYDDFAHHPTAIETTLQGLRSKLGDNAKITAVIEPRSNTMKQGVHQQQLADCVNLASQVFWFEPEDLSWSLHQVARAQSNRAWVINSVEILVDAVLAQASQGEHIVVMSNGGFGGFHQQLVEKLRRT
ncbi:MAG: UDP-N-acetylmuramate:L-alanyl-gamma-D-glutamyl-meso-diaminopimelate ligase, partial [Pseudomonadota bacterium]|nr:UDP-N-acetylmuramate:L-alanyl-gamma-D-glutamyl-meso-diaminopimelate ligase [Pseudomonadota bacterium]